MTNSFDDVITSDQFRDALRYFAAGVTLVTAQAGGKRRGMTVSAFTSVSAEPPLIAVVINRQLTIHPLLQAPDTAFAVNFLSADQAHLSDRFSRASEEDRFLEGNWQSAVTGAPVLADALAWLDCSPHAHYEAGSHIIYLGQVRACRVNRPADLPLVYWNRGYRSLRDEAQG